MQTEPEEKESVGTTGTRALLRGLSNVILCLTAFFVGVQVIGALDSKESSRTWSVKLRHFLEHKDDYGVIFVGNSYVFRHIIPAEFDSLTAAAGRPTRSYNLGVPAHTFFEIHYQLRQILDSNPARLEWIILDVSFKWELRRLNLHTQRFVAWHDIPETLRAIWYTLVRCEPKNAPYDPINEKNRQNNLHLEAAFTRGTHRGRGFKIVKALLGSGSRTKGRDPVFAEGYLPLEDSPGAAYRNSHFLENIEAFEKSLLGGVQPDLQRMPPYKQALLNDLIEMVESKNIKLMIICGPILEDRIEFAAGDSVTSNPHHLFLYNDSDRYPGLYRADRRFDRRHLNKLGAMEFTRIVGADFLNLLEPERH